MTRSRSRPTSRRPAASSRPGILRPRAHRFARRLRRALPREHRVARDVLEPRDGDARLPHAVDEAARVEAAARAVVRRRHAQRHRELPRSPPARPTREQDRDRLGGRAAATTAHAHVRRAAPRGRALRRRAAPSSASKKGDRVAIYMGMVPEVAVAMLACARIGATAHAWSSAASPPTRCAIASTTAGPRSSSRRTAAGAAATWCRSRRWSTRRSRRRPSVEKVLVFRRLGARAGPDRDEGGPRRRVGRGARAPPTRQARRESRRSSTPSIRSSSSTRRARPASRRACCTRPPATSSARTSPPSTSSICARRRLLVHRRRRLGHRPQLHRLRPALERRDVPDVRGRAELARLGPLLAASSRSTASRSSTRRRPRSAPSSAPGDEWPQKHDLSSLRLLGTVGEPINPEAWIWYHEHDRRRPLPDRRHVVADRDRLDHADDAARRALLEARLDGPAVLRRRRRPS